MSEARETEGRAKARRRVAERLRSADAPLASMTAGYTEAE